MQRLTQATRDKLKLDNWKRNVPWPTIKTTNRKKHFESLIGVLLPPRENCARKSSRKKSAKPSARPPSDPTCAAPIQQSLCLPPPPVETPKRFPAFENLVRMLGSNAAMVLGAYADPRTGQPMLDPEAARELIDMLDALHEKTKGNLAPEEDTLLLDLLGKLKMTYLEINQAVAAEAAKPRPRAARKRRPAAFRCCIAIDFNVFNMPPAPLKITVLGSGTSMGVPTLGCPCRVCASTDPHDNRLRPSLLISRGGQNVVIDTTPDFRQQAMRAGLDRLDAILLTARPCRPHPWLRRYSPVQYPSARGAARLRQRRHLSHHPARVRLRLRRQTDAQHCPSVDAEGRDQPFELLGIPFVPVPLLHGEMEVLGFRFGRAAYLTDFSVLPDSSMALLEGLDELILDALRDIPHPMHQTVEQALALIARLKPRRAWFTHIAHDLPHAETNARLVKMGFPHVQLAYDGLQFEVQWTQRMKCRTEHAHST